MDLPSVRILEQRLVEGNITKVPCILPCYAPWNGEPQGVERELEKKKISMSERETMFFAKLKHLCEVKNSAEMLMNVGSLQTGLHIRHSAEIS